LLIVAIDVRHYVPAVRFEALRRVVGKPTFHFAINRNSIVIVEANQLAKLERPRERAGFVRNAFHEIAIASEHISEVVDDIESRAVEFGRKHPLGGRHANSIGEALPQRAGRGFDSWS
jgi:hypothetical protein